MAGIESEAELRKEKLIGQTTSSFFGFSFCLYGSRALYSKILAGSVATSDKINLGLGILVGLMLLVCAFIFGIFSFRHDTPGWVRRLGKILWSGLFVATGGGIMLTALQIVALESLFPEVNPLLFRVLFYIVFVFFLLYLAATNPWQDLWAVSQKLTRKRHN